MRNPLFSQSQKIDVRPFDEEWLDEDVKRLNSFFEGSKYEHKEPIFQEQLVEFLQIGKLRNLYLVEKEETCDKEDQLKEDRYEPQEYGYLE